ncbi:monofunctional biosynthetic peptidoglycan transglycosylase [Candidatus Haliotispira prima]|uniref:Monofunctional biosynthetic peptidoglycan transglycosylase n=1 Tax=Candidatus Haliotispira prima TaxID=3034016 RepID=A0ABY8MK68_9SPIO|nr:monofunctional biosynthetic peptidoglycan transglycosylase [Candidatus Haliotispira prima]
MFKFLLLLFVLLQLSLILYYKYFPVPYTTTMLERQAGALRKAWLLSFDKSSETAVSIDLAYDWVPYEEMSDWAKLAVISLEDSHFATHHGPYWPALRKALAEGRGGSTITQQVVKNALLWQGRGWSRYLRKALEIPLSYIVDWFWGKRRVLEIYLNIIEVGPMIFGMEMAAQEFFGHSAAELTLYRAALVAAALPNPRYYNVRNPSRLMRRRQKTAVARMIQLRRSGYLTRF